MINLIIFIFAFYREKNSLSYKMKGRKSSRDSRKLRSSRKLEREINDFEEVSSQSYGDSIDHQRKITHLVMYN